MDESFKSITDCFSDKLTNAAGMRFNDLCEIRIRAGKPVVMYFLNKPHFLRSDGTFADTYESGLEAVSFDELQKAFEKLCSYSVYKHIENMTKGFITVGGGHRIGVCGSSVVSGGEVLSVTDVTGLNIRAAKEYCGCASFIFHSVDLSRGALICGIPSSGKTTLLRDIAKTLSFDMLKKVSIADERCEIASRLGGRSGFDVGLSDVYSGYPKSAALTLAVRTMSPDYIICDELTGEDSANVMQALNCGVTVISAVHCDSLETLMRNPSLKRLAATRAFQKLIFLSGTVPAKIKEIYDIGEITID